MASHCLLVTHLSLTDLQQKRYGIYRRLAMLVESARATGVALRIFCLEPSRPESGDIDAQARAIAADVAATWGIDCEIVVGYHRAPSRLPWLFQQLLGVLNYRWDWLPARLLDRESRTRLAQEIARGPAFVIGHRLPMTSHLLPLLPAGAPLFFDLDDIEHLASLRGIPQQRSLRTRLFTLLTLPGLFLAEARAIARARRTFVCSTIDAERAARQFRTDKLFVLPNAIDMPAPDALSPPDAAGPSAARPSAARPIAARPILLMLGVYSYGPNLDAADWFVEQIFPLIQARNPDAEVWFVGGAPESLKSYRTDDPHVRFLGFVDDLAAIYRQAKVVICPIRHGSGTRVKLVEAAAWAKPIVTTTIGAEGLNMVDGIHAVYGDDAATFAQQCVKLLDDDAACAQLGRNARALAEQTYDKRRIVRMLTAELSTAID